MSSPVPTFECGSYLAGWFPPDRPLDGGEGGGGGGNGTVEDGIDPEDFPCCCFMGRADAPEIVTITFPGPSGDQAWRQTYRQVIPGECLDCATGEDQTDAVALVASISAAGWDGVQMTCPDPPENCLCGSDDCPDCVITGYKEGTGKPPAGWTGGPCPEGTDPGPDGLCEGDGGGSTDFVPGAECNFDSNCEPLQECIDHECFPRYTGDPGYPNYGIDELQIPVNDAIGLPDFILEASNWPYPESEYTINTTDMSPPFASFFNSAGTQTGAMMSDGLPYLSDASEVMDWDSGTITMPSPGNRHFMNDFNTPVHLGLSMVVEYNGVTTIYGYGMYPEFLIPIITMEPFTAGGGQGRSRTLGDRTVSDTTKQRRNRGLGKKGPLGDSLPKNKTSRVRVPSFKGLLKAGAALVRKEKKGTRERIAELQEKPVVNLDDPVLKREYQKKRPSGFQDGDIALSQSRINGSVNNTTGFDELFKDMIDISIAYLLKNSNKIQNWEDKYLNGLDVGAVINSLRPEILEMFRKIINADGTPLSNHQIYGIIGSRILEGTLGKLDINVFKKIAAKHENRKVTILKSRSNSVNQKAALSILESAWHPLSPSANASIGEEEMMKNWKVFSTDISKYIPVMINGKLEKYYVADDDTFIERSTLSIQDGDYFKFYRDGREQRLYCQSEIDHAFTVSTEARQKALRLLNGDTAWTMTASTDASADLEFNYSLSAPRQNYYVLSAVLSSLETTPSEQSYLLKNSKITYQLMDTSTASGISGVNDYIRYKLPWRSYTINDDDRLLDYLEHTGEVKVSQHDILFDAPKTNKRTPLLVRQVPWYIIIWPTNRMKYLLFNGKSNITQWDPSGQITREQKFYPDLDPILGSSKSSKFITQLYDGSVCPDVYGSYTPYSRRSYLLSGAYLFENGYKVRGELGSAQKLAPLRSKTTFRKIRDIITELNTNYLLDDEGLGYGLNTFDVISRLSLTEYAKYRSIENYRLLNPLLRNGLIAGIKVYEPIRNAGKMAIKKTRILQRKSTATTDKWPPVKSMATGYMIVPPTTSPNSNAFGFVPNEGERGTRTDPRTL